MSWSALAEGIYGLYAADTGSGGLAESGGDLELTGWFNEEAPRDQEPPYVVVSLVTGDEDHVGDPDSVFIEYEFQVDVFIDRERGQPAGEAYRDRVRHILHRKTPTVTGYTAHHLFRQGGQEVIEDQRRRFIEEYTGTIAKGA